MGRRSSYLAGRATWDSGLAALDWLATHQERAVWATRCMFRSRSAWSDITATLSLDCDESKRLHMRLIECVAGNNIISLHWTLVLALRSSMLFCVRPCGQDREGKRLRLKESQAEAYIGAGGASAAPDVVSKDATEDPVLPEVRMRSCTPAIPFFNCSWLGRTQIARQLCRR